MLGQVEGRTADDVAYWLAQQTPAWRDRIRYVAIDMCTVFVAAIRRYLPNATIVVDHFHVVKLANDTVAEVRRRIATQLRGRRGRKTDPEYTVRNLLRRNREDLSDTAFAKLWNTLVDLEGPGLTILKTWIAKEELRRLLALAGTGADRSVISHRLYRFYTWCADAAVPELDGTTVTCVVTEFAMKHWSWARWCIWSNVAASGSAPRKTIRGKRMTVVIAIRPASFLAITPTAWSS